nr:ATPase, T2SS/T4P/T4SS family [Ruminiclostridium josui]
MINYRNSFVENRIARIIELLAGKGRRNVAIIGEQGSGKTTAADELIIKQLDADISIGLAENIHELNISSNYPGKNIVELQYTKEFKPSDITEVFFRLNRDIVIYGEVRNSYEAFEMIKAMLRQARGSLFTFHSSSPRRMIHDIRQLLMQTGYYTDFREAQFDVADAVDLIIHIKLDRETGQRYVYKVSEVLACEENMTFEINDLFVFDMERGKYITTKNGLSKQQLLSCMEYEFTKSDAEELSRLFCGSNFDSESGVAVPEGDTL